MSNAVGPRYPAITSGSVMKPLVGDQAVLDGERPLEHDRSHVSLARDGAPRLELGRGDPEVLIPHSAEERQVRLPHHGHAPNLDRVLILHGGPLSESAPSTRGKGEVPCRRRAAGLRTGSQSPLLLRAPRVKLFRASSSHGMRWTSVPSQPAILACYLATSCCTACAFVSRVGG